MLHIKKQLQLSWKSLILRMTIEMPYPLKEITILLSHYWQHRRNIWLLREEHDRVLLCGQ